MTDRDSMRRRADAGGLMTDFDALYQGQGMSFGEGESRLEVIPWRLDGPQPLIVELEAAGEITGPVLECGCGFGDNALFLAERGYEVTAFDFAPTVIDQARAKARAQGASVNFVVADATTMHGIPEGFRTVVDSAMLHCLTDEQRQQYLAALRQVCQPGARLHVLCFQANATRILPFPASLDEASLRQAFGDGWHLRRLLSRRYTSSLTRTTVRQMPADLNAVLPDLDDPEGVDEQGRVLLPIWQITAERA